MPLCDLDLPYKSSNARDRVLMLQRAYALGWDCIAWSTVLSCSQLQSGNKKGMSTGIKPLEPVSLDKIQTRDALAQRALIISDEEAKALGAGKQLPPLPSSSSSSLAAALPKQLNRLTLIVDDPNDLHILTDNSISNTIIKEYDLIALRPTTTKAFFAVCLLPGTCSIPISLISLISLDISHKLFAIPSKALEAASLQS